LNNTTAVLRQLSELYNKRDFNAMSEVLMSVAQSDALSGDESVRKGLMSIILHMREIGLIQISDLQSAFGAMLIVFALGRMFESEGRVEVHESLFQSLSEITSG
jgi:hypothetical protein